MNTIWGLLDWIWPSSNPIHLRDDRQLSLAATLREYAPPPRAAQIARAPSTPSRTRSHSNAAASPPLARAYTTRDPPSASSYRDRRDSYSLAPAAHHDRRDSYSHPPPSHRDRRDSHSNPPSTHRDRRDSHAHAHAPSSFSSAASSSWDQLERGDVEHERQRERARVDGLVAQNAALRDEATRLARALDVARAELAAAQQDLAHLSSRETALGDTYETERAAHEAERTAHEAERAAHAASRAALDATASELATLRAFLDKTDAWTGAQVVQAVADLNTEIVQLGAAVADAFFLAPAGVPDPDVKAENAPARVRGSAADRELVRASVGPTMASLLQAREHGADPTLVGLALQAWEVHCCAQVFGAFCFGLPGDVDRFLHGLYAHMLESSGASLSASAPSTSLTFSFGAFFF
jgi:hypothetical protein